MLSEVARHGWTPRDVNQLITDWVGTGHWIPESPHKPIGLLGAILAAHGNPGRTAGGARGGPGAGRARCRASSGSPPSSPNGKPTGRHAKPGAPRWTAPGARAARQVLDEIARRARRAPPDRRRRARERARPRRLAAPEPEVPLACHLDPDHWFDRAARTASLAACLACPFRRWCARRALQYRPSWGMWAGVWIDGRFAPPPGYLDAIAADTPLPRSPAAAAAPRPGRPRVGRSRHLRSG